jgi:hypothetical protein
VEKKAPIASLQTANGGHFLAFRTCCNTSAALTYFARIKIKGKLIRQSLETTGYFK